MKNNPTTNNFIQQNSPDGGFLQSDSWVHFQSSAGRKIFNVKKDGFWANIVEHKLPIVGKYFYIPRGPVLEIAKPKIQTKEMREMVDLARKNKAGWVRIEAATEEILELIKKSMDFKIVKAPHDMQPREIFIMDIEKKEEDLLAQMKAKTRYNIKLAEKKGVEVIMSREKKYLDRFFELVEITAKRQSITSHSKSYYQNMIESIPEENIKIFCGKFEGQIIAANLVLFFNETATYLHGASDDNFRNSMAPYLLQWRQIQEAKKSGAKKYDFGGIKTTSEENSWAGITRFKRSFSPKTQPFVFPGAYDIIISATKYNLYRFIQKIKCIL
ncbi:MAG: hypothetical protein ACD_15C00195G0009 [uncultured bacterium]|nr:MAG: hypothetical protein ACD_15C00195G0009 [uncultured bacterium]HCU70499.1 hypothetical protein [Candidatus Moranbacteria bacterium]